MKKTAIKSLAIILALLVLIDFSAAQKKAVDDTEAVATAVLSTATGTATVEMTVDADPLAGTAIGFKLYKKDANSSTRLLSKDAVPECGGSMPVDDVCRRGSGPGLKLIYTFSSLPRSGSRFEAFLDITDAKKGEIGQIVRVASENAPRPDLDKKTKIIVEQQKPRVLQLQVRYAYEVSNLPDEDRPYIKKHVDELYSWLARAGNKVRATVRVEPRKPRIPKPGETNEITPQPAQPQVPGARKDGPEPQPIEYKVTAVHLSPGAQYDKQLAVDILLETDQAFPSGKYDVEITFSDDPPAEIAKPILKSMPGVAAMAAPDASKQDKTLGLRDLKNNLDAGVSYTSSVESVRVGNQTIRQRQNNGTFDVRFAPWLKGDYDRDKYFLTPVFVDAKISTGELSKKTLSTNRIIFGSKLTIDKRIRDNEYLFTFIGQHTSDRDFKRAEVTFSSEFRPVPPFLNKPLEKKTHSYQSILIKTQEPKEVPYGWFGYRIQPFIKVELGHVYHAERNAFDGEELSPNIRRLAFGMDIALNLTSHAKLSLWNTLYVRGEDRRDRLRNHFKTELQAPIFVSGTTSQCLFFSFEKGDEPPFATPTVNAFKIGYRITSNIFGVNK